MRSSLRSLLAASVCLVVSTGVARAQYDNGSLVGTIKDTTGAPIPGAQVILTNPATGISTTVTSGGTGDYEFPSVKVGDYTVIANAPGFSKAEADHISITVGNRARIDLGLKVGGTETTVEVSGVALQVEADQSQRDQLITNYQSEAFPLVSRNYSDLLGLVTGSRQAPSAATTTSINSLVRAGSYNINGQRSVFNNYQLDGIDNNSYGESNQGFDNQIIAIPPDSVSQFSIVTNNEAAEYGRSSGATINVSSLSGTNAFHGAVYEFIRNTALNAPGFFKPTVIGSTGITTPFKKPTFNRNQFGFNVGGPILHDRLFFFVDYEGFRQVLKPLSVLTLPTQNELNGIFVVPVRNPLTGDVFAPGDPRIKSENSRTSAQIITAFQQISGLPTAGAAATGLASSDYSVQEPFTDSTPTRATCGSTSSRTQPPPGSCACQTARKTRSTHRRFRCRLMARPTAASACSTSRWSSAIRVLFGANKVLDIRAGLSRTKAGKFSTSIGSTSFSIPGEPTNPTVAGGLPTTSISGFSAFGRQSTNPSFRTPPCSIPS